MKIILLTGNQPNQQALAQKVANEFDLVGIVLEVKPSPKIGVKKLIAKIFDLIFYLKISNAWKNLMAFYRQKFGEFPKTAVLKVSNINDPQVIEFIQSLNPDLIMVSGTSLIKKHFFVLNPPKGIVNLHTGLSPYVKGGPNCTNWCLANDEFFLIGNTVMWLDAGIDSGNIITTDFVNFSGEESLDDIHRVVMESAHDLYLQALRKIATDFENVPNIKQSSIDKGKLFLSKMWTNNQKKLLVQNIQNGRFKKVVNSSDFKIKRDKITLIKL